MSSRRKPLLLPMMVATLLVTVCGDQPAATEPTSDPAEPTITDSMQPVTTAPRESPGDLLVVGSWGSGTLPQGAVAGEMMRYAEANEIAAILTTGDNFFADDADFLMVPYGWATDSGIPFWVTWGDIDIETEARVEAVAEAFTDPPKWGVHEWGAVKVVILDSNQIDSSEQLAFLASAISSNRRPTIVVMHHPPYSCPSGEDPTAILDSWIPLLDDDVFLVLSGHERNYQRFEVAGVNYVVTGGGGESLTRIEACHAPHPDRSYGESIHHFLVIQQTDVLSASSIDVNGNVVDEFELKLP